MKITQRIKNFIKQIKQKLDTHPETRHLEKNKAQKFFPPHQKVPKHASTHYAYNIHPINDTAKKTQRGFAARPVIQRKMLKSNNSGNTATATNPASQVITAPTMPKAKRKKFRKNIDKAALADHFDNYKSDDAVLQSKQEWLDSVVCEPNKADQTNTEEKQLETLYFVISSRSAPLETATEFENEQLEAYKTYLQHLDERLADWEMDALINYDYYIDTRLDINKYLAKFDAKEAAEIVAQKERQTAKPINEFVKDRFVKKHNGTDTSEAMRAFEKQKRHNTKWARLMHELQITK